MYMYNIVLDSLDNPTIDEIMGALEEMAIKYSKTDDANNDTADDENDTSDCDGDCENCEFNEQQPIEFDINVHDPAIDFCLDYFGDTPEDEYDAHDQDEYDAVDHPFHYTSHGLETIDKIEAVIDGLPAKEAAMLANVLKYFDRAGLKDDAHQDLEKANNYAHRLVYGHWKHENN